VGLFVSLTVFHGSSKTYRVELFHSHVTIVRSMPYWAGRIVICCSSHPPGLHVLPKGNRTGRGEDPEGGGGGGGGGATTGRSTYRTTGGHRDKHSSLSAGCPGYHEQQQRERFITSVLTARQWIVVEPMATTEEDSTADAAATDAFWPFSKSYHRPWSSRTRPRDPSHWHCVDSVKWALFRSASP
jgi:hypothetical protein